MPKLTNVTDAELHDLIGRMEDLSAELAEVSDKITFGYCDEITAGTDKAARLSWIARDTAELSGRILTRMRMQDMNAEVARLRADAGREALK